MAQHKTTCPKACLAARTMETSAYFTVSRKLDASALLYPSFLASLDMRQDLPDEGYEELK